MSLNIEPQLVAVYGSLREGLHNHRLLEDSDYLGLDWTDPDYTMLSLGSFPGIVEGGETAIKIEVYQVNQDTFTNLDRLEGYPNFYNRKKIETKFGDAWIYFLEGREYSTTYVPSGDWKEAV